MTSQGTPEELGLKVFLKHLFNCVTELAMKYPAEEHLGTRTVTGLVQVSDADPLKMAPGPDRGTAVTRGCPSFEAVPGDDSVEVPRPLLQLYFSAVPSTPFLPL